MKNFVVGVNNLYDNDLKLIKVKAFSEKEAIVLAVGDSIDIFEDFEILTVDYLIQYYFDGELIVSKPLEIKEF